MLYVSTRNSKDAHTAYKALTQTECPDGGRYVPFRLPEFSAGEIEALAEKDLGQNIADILNLFFSSRLTGWDVDSCIGRNSVKLSSMNHKILIAELWRNLNGKYAYAVQCLYKAVLPNGDAEQPSEWFRIVVRIAFLFGLYGQMRKDQLIAQGELIDVSVPVGDFSAPMSLWYCRTMGLPVGTVICSQIENNVIWDWIHRGAFNSALADAVLISGMERLVRATMGEDALETYLEKTSAGRIYTIDTETLPVANKGFFCSVAGTDRIDSVINSVFRTSQYLVTPDTALCFGGLQDYRAKTGESRMTLLFSEDAPMEHIGQISAATGVSGEKLMLNKDLL